MLLESIGYNCQHPKKNTVGVNIEYSRRYFTSSENSSLENDSDSDTFFNNIKFKEC
jgi:tRNA(Glu) U13 pseudouridine synthase TruD